MRSGSPQSTGTSDAMWMNEDIVLRRDILEKGTQVQVGVLPFSFSFYLSFLFSGKHSCPAERDPGFPYEVCGTCIMSIALP